MRFYRAVLNVFYLVYLIFAGKNKFAKFFNLCTNGKRGGIKYLPVLTCFCACKRSLGCRGGSFINTNVIKFVVSINLICKVSIKNPVRYMLQDVCTVTRTTEKKEANFSSIAEKIYISKIKTELGLVIIIS